MIEKINQMFIKINQDKKLKTLISGVIFAVGIIVVMAYIVLFERNEVNSDYTDTLLWAYESIKGRSVYNHNFYYAYMLPFGGSLIMGIPALIWGFSYKAHVVGMLLFAMIMSIALYIFYKTVFKSLNAGLCLTGFTLTLFTCTKNMRLIFWGHVIQYSLGILMLCIAFYLIDKVFDDEEEISLKNRRVVLLFVFSLLCMTNGVNIAPFYLMPLLFGVILEALSDKNCLFGDKKFNQVIRLSLLLLIAGVLGYCINVLLQRGIDKTYVDTLMSYRTVDTWFFSVRELLATWCSLGVDGIASGEEILSLNGVMAGCMYVFSLLILIIPCVALAHISKIESRLIRILIFAHHIIVLTTWLMVSVILTDNIGHEWRWGGAYASAIITSLVFIVWSLSKKDLKRWGVILCAFLAVAGLLIVSKITKLDRTYGANNIDRVKDTLIENGLSYGYADFWDANAITMLSNSKVKARAIELDVFENGGAVQRAVPYRYQSEEEWYNDQPGVERYFVYLSSTGYEMCPPELKNAAVDTIITEGNGCILVYNNNIFSNGESIYDR